jgi:hypothetical protein
MTHFCHRPASHVAVAKSRHCPLPGCSFEPLRCCVLSLGANMRRREFLGGVVATAAWPLATLAQQSQSQDGPFQFGLIGDMPYTHVQEQQYQRVLAALNNAASPLLSMLATRKMIPGVTIQTQALDCSLALMKITRRSSIRFKASGIQSSSRRATMIGPTAI